MVRVNDAAYQRGHGYATEFTKTSPMVAQLQFLLIRLANRIVTGEEEGTSSIEPWMLAYALPSQGHSVTTEEMRLLKEETYECPVRWNTSVTSRW